MLINAVRSVVDISEIHWDVTPLRINAARRVADSGNSSGLLKSLRKFAARSVADKLEICRYCAHLREYNSFTNIKTSPHNTGNVAFNLGRKVVHYSLVYFNMDRGSEFVTISLN